MIMKFLKKIPAGMMVVPMLLGAFINTFFPQDRCTDHRIGLTVHNLDKIMDGNLDEIIDALATHEQAEKLRQLNAQAE